MSGCLMTRCGEYPYRAPTGDAAGGRRGRRAAQCLEFISRLPQGWLTPMERWAASYRAASASGFPLPERIEKRAGRHSR